MLRSLSSVHGRFPSHAHRAFGLLPDPQPHPRGVLTRGARSRGMGPVNTRGDNVDEGAVGGDGPRRRPRFALLAAATTVLVAALLGAAAAPAVAVAVTAEPQAAAAAEPRAAVAPTDASPPTAEPTASPDPSEIAPPSTGRPGAPLQTPTRPAVRPTIADPGDVTTGTTRFHGTGTPGHSVRVSGPTATGSSGCTARVGSDGSWACLGTVRSGPQQVFTVRDLVATGLPVANAPASDVIVPPTLQAAGPTGGTVSGTGFPGSTVTLSVSGSTTEQTAPVGPDGRWVAALGTRADGRFTVTASQTASTARGYRSDLRSAASAPVTVTVDRTAPAAPRITTPDDGQRIGTRSTTVTGTGEPGARVTVYVDRAPVCGVVVGTDASWSCSTAGSTLRAGEHRLTATQHDAAGNYSRSSAAVRVTAGSATTAPTGTPTPGATDTPGAPEGRRRAPTRRRAPPARRAPASTARPALARPAPAAAPEPERTAATTATVATAPRPAVAQAAAVAPAPAVRPASAAPEDTPTGPAPPATGPRRPPTTAPSRPSRPRSRGGPSWSPPPSQPGSSC
ncbi:Ig-like domain-containing protein [Curtobacterium sp. Arg-1]|uniref:Ig-like domain-containing protein n=1 Tax=Curtobacterium sp. Arg-1 TaxID=2935040 RepID=UPI003988259E